MAKTHGDVRTLNCKAREGPIQAHIVTFSEALLFASICRIRRVEAPSHRISEEVRSSSSIVL